MCAYIYIYIHMHTYVHIYIYIYIVRHAEDQARPEISSRQTSCVSYLAKSQRCIYIYIHYMNYTYYMVSLNMK